MNIHPSPREDNVRDYLKSLQRQDAQRDREQFADKSRDTLLDGYTEDEFESVCRELWKQGGVSPECHFRTLVDLLLRHYMLTRGGDRRSAEISGIFTFEFKGEGPSRCFPLIFTTCARKQNQHGRLETIGALRHKNPLVCMLGGLAFYLLYRWDLTDETFPDFASRPAWYGIRLMKRANGDRHEPLSYTTQREWVGRAFQYVGIFAKKKTYIGRAAGAKTAELKGVSEEQIRRAGRWNQEQMVGCYLNSLPREFMRRMAGHPAQVGCFEIRRASIVPPDELLSQIWPELDIWRDRFGPLQGQVNDLAAMGLTSLLFYLREVILQDSVVLRRQFPDNAIWMHPVFQHPAYAPFAQQVEASIYEGEGPNQLSQLLQAVPMVVDILQSIEARRAQQEVSSRQYATEIHAAIQTINTAQVEQARQLQQLLSGGMTFRLVASSTAPPVPPAPRQLLPAGPVLPAVESSYQPGHQPGQQDQQDQQHSVIPVYRMSRTVKTVDRLWHEWTIGFTGSPSIQALDRQWGCRWRAGRRSELQWYSLRQEIIRQIQRIAQAQRIGDEAAMWQVNLQQQRMGCSLDQLCKRLRAGRRGKAS
jgi:hypothetical protein